MKLAIAVAFALVAVASAGTGRSLSQTDSSTCTTEATLRFRVKSGRCSGVAHADCRAFGSAEAEISSHTQILINSGVCIQENVESFARSSAKAIAKVFSKAFTRIRCTGQGGGCGWAISEGTAFATALAQSFSKTILGLVSADHTLRAFCVADVEALSVAFADVAAIAQADACQFGPGISRDFERIFVQTISNAIAEASTNAFARVCQIGNTQSKCRAEGTGVAIAPTKTIVRTPGGTKRDGTGFARGGQLQGCEGAEDFCCGNPQWCGQLFMKLDTDIGTDRKLVYVFGNPVPKCFCY